MLNIQMVKVVASHESIERQVHENIKNPFDALNEYIWNAIDANAKNVNIVITTSSDSIKSLEITDNGEGINFEDLYKDLFLEFNTSRKHPRENQSLPRGKKGFGRFSFILFASKARWDTIYFDKKEKNSYKYNIEIEGYELDNFKPNNKTQTSKSNGTSVSFVFSTSNNQNLITTKSKDLLKKIKENISLEFCWIIELLDLKITINNNPIDYSEFMEKPIVHNHTIGEESFKIKFIKWKQALKNQSSRYYLLNSKGEEVFVDTTTLNYKSDDFYHSIYVTGKYFDNFITITGRFEDTYKQLMDYVNDYLKKQRKPYIKIFSKNKYDEFKEKNILPKFNKFEEKVKAPIYEDVVREIIEFAPSLVSNTNESQRKLLLELINKLLDDESLRRTLFNILEILIDDDNKEQLKELEEKLKKYGLKNLLGTIRAVENRLESVKRLSKMTSDDKWYYSESDLQKEIEEHFWIFGEEYNLMIGAEEDDFTKLRKLYYEKVKKMQLNEYEQLFVSKKQVDLFICGISPEGRLNRNLIVEIKKPKELLKKGHYLQIDDYKDIILNIPEFNTPETNHWDFILLYTDVSKDYVTFFENEIKNKFTGLAKENNKNYRIYIRKWSDLLGEVTFKLRFLKDVLEERKKKL